MRGCAPARVDAAAVVRMAPAYAAGGRRGRQGRHCICARDRGSSSAVRERTDCSGAPAIEIVIGAATVRIAPGTDAATLQTVLRAVMAAS